MCAFYLIYNEPSFRDLGSLMFIDVKMSIFLPAGWVDIGGYIHHYFEKDYYQLSLPLRRLYKFAENIFDAGQFLVRLFANPRPYYFDDFLEMCGRKGYTVEESGYWLTIYLPENHSNSWFL